MLDDTFPRVKFECKTAPQKLVEASGEQVRHLGEQADPFKTNEEIHRCRTFLRASVVKPLICLQKVVRAWNIVVLDEKNPHFRITRD